MKTLLAISTLLFVATGCGTSENQQAERDQASAPMTIATTLATTTASNPISCNSAAQDFAYQFELSYIRDNPDLVSGMRDAGLALRISVQDANEIHHETIEPGIRVCQIFIRATIGNRSETYSGILCTNDSTFFWMGSDTQRKVVDEIEDCQIFIDTR